MSCPPVSKGGVTIIGPRFGGVRTLEVTALSAPVNPRCFIGKRRKEEYFTFDDDRSDHGKTIDESAKKLVHTEMMYIMTDE